MAETILIAIGVIYLVIGFIMASVYVAFDNGVSPGGGDKSGPIVWLGIFILWLPAILYYFFKLAGPIILALIVYPFRRR